MEPLGSYTDQEQKAVDEAERLEQRAAAKRQEATKSYGDRHVAANERVAAHDQAIRDSYSREGWTKRRDDARQAFYDAVADSDFGQAWAEWHLVEDLFARAANDAGDTMPTGRSRTTILDDFLHATKAMEDRARAEQFARDTAARDAAYQGR